MRIVFVVFTINLELMGAEFFFSLRIVYGFAFVSKNHDYFWMFWAIQTHILYEVPTLVRLQSECRVSCVCVYIVDWHRWQQNAANVPFVNLCNVPHSAVIADQFEDLLLSWNVYIRFVASHFDKWWFGVRPLKMVKSR